MFDFEIYEVDCGFDGFYMRVDLTRAEAPIATRSYQDDSPWDRWEGCQYQTADANHDAHKAAVLCIQCCGPDWYRAPGEEDLQASDIPYELKHRPDLEKNL